LGATTENLHAPTNDLPFLKVTREARLPNAY
jgi:hypothetical protein